MLLSDSLNCLSVNPMVWFETVVQITNRKWIVPDGREFLRDTVPIVDPGLYILEYTSEKGCTYRDTLGVKDFRNEYNVTVFSDTIDCDNTVVTASAIADRGGLNYLWIKGLDTLSQDSTLMLNTGGAYILIADDGQGCIVRDSFLISVDTTSPAVNLITPDTLNCRDTLVEISIEAVNIREIEWLFNSTLIGDSSSLIVRSSCMRP